MDHDPNFTFFPHRRTQIHDVLVTCQVEEVPTRKSIQGGRRHPPDHCAGQGRGTMVLRPLWHRALPGLVAGA